MITLQNISKTYGELAVLQDINLTIPKAKIVSIVGASGAGKTTLLQIIGTLLKPDAGSIIFNDQQIDQYNEAQLALFRNQRIGFVFQFHHLLPEFSAFENICLPAYIAKTPSKQVEQKADELLAFLKLTHRKTHKPNELSGGEQQRVAVARALINSPELILADEPSGNLDTLNKKELHQLFFDLRDHYNQTFVIVTHDMELAEMSDMTIRMKDGRIIDPETI
jgi:lipoprotein-releasing system ATP-binding protein